MLLPLVELVGIAIIVLVTVGTMPLGLVNMLNSDIVFLDSDATVSEGVNLEMVLKSDVVVLGLGVVLTLVFRGGGVVEGLIEGSALR